MLKKAFNLSMKNKHQLPLEYEAIIEAPFGAVGIIAPVSYTHLDVYKRQLG